MKLKTLIILLLFLNTSPFAQEKKPGKILLSIGAVATFNYIYGLDLSIIKQKDSNFLVGHSISLFYGEEAINYEFENPDEYFLICTGLIIGSRTFLFSFSPTLSYQQPFIITIRGKISLYFALLYQDTGLMLGFNWITQEINNSSTIGISLHIVY